MKYGFTVCIMIGILFLMGSCEEDQICDENARTYLNAGFYKAEEGALQDSVLNNLKIRAIGMDSLIYDSSGISKIKLPLDYGNSQTSFLMINDSVSDTLRFTYDKKMIFISYQCGFAPTYNLLSTTNSYHGIDSAIIINSKIETLDEENLRIYL